MNETLHLGITLMVISLVAGTALALTNYFTAPIIESQKESAMKKSLNQVIKADSFKENNAYSAAYDSQGNPVGKVLKVAVKGYSSIINAIVGVDNGNKVTGIEIISQQETPGLGTRIVESSFLNQFIGKSVDGLKIKKDGGKIDAITGATISSRAITNGVRQAIDQSIGKNQISESNPEQSANQGQIVNAVSNSNPPKSDNFNGNSAEKVLNVAVNGYISMINAIARIDANNKITGIEVTSQKETLGYGIQDNSFLNQFIGKTVDEIKLRQDGGKIDAITGATTSSRAITNGVRQAIEQSMGKNQTSAISAGQIVNNDDSEDDLEDDGGEEDD